MEIGISIPKTTSTIQITDCNFRVREPRYTYPVHYHQLFEFLHCWGGEATQWINDKPYIFRAGDWILLKSCVKHRMYNHSSSPFSYFSVHFDIDNQETRELLNTCAREYIDRRQAERTMLPEYVKQIEQILQMEVAEPRNRIHKEHGFIALSNVNQIAMQAYILLIIKEIIALRSPEEQEVAAAAPPSDISITEINAAHAIEQLLRDSLLTDGSVSRIAERLNLSRTRCTKIFTKVYGISPRQYMSQMKLNKAKELLTNTNMTVEEIAFTLGFHSISHFSRQFRRWTGSSPNRFRPKYPRVSKE